jgi:hypothetical protein
LLLLAASDFCLGAVAVKLRSGLGLKLKARFCGDFKVQLWLVYPHRQQLWLPTAKPCLKMQMQKRRMKPMKRSDNLADGNPLAFH